MPKSTITEAVLEKARRDSVPGAKQSDISDALAPGLLLRIGATGAIWQFRFEMHGRSSRLTLGSINEWTIAEAREIVGEARKLIRGKIRRPDDDWVQEQRIEHGKVAAPEKAAEHRHSIYWTYAQAVDHYLQFVQRSRSADTHVDYRKSLLSADMKPLLQRPVPSIARRDLSEIIAKVHASGRESTAEGLARKLKPFWKWLADDLQTDYSGIKDEVMRGLKAPPRSRKTAQQRAMAPTRYVPSMLEVGRILAIARSGALSPILGAAIELLVFAPQRRKAISMAMTDNFEPILDGTEGVWIIPPHHRKTAEMQEITEDLVLPLPAPAWAAVQKAKAVYAPVEYPYLFRSEKGSTGHIERGQITKTLNWMPGVAASPHDLRRALATHGQKQLGIPLIDIKALLDHTQGIDPADVTMTSYALHDGTHRSWPVARAWAAHVEKACAEALASDHRLHDVEYLREHIRHQRERSKGRTPKVSLVRPDGYKRPKDVNADVGTVEPTGN